MFVVNKRNTDVVIDDLKLVIKAKQVVDLDRISLPVPHRKSEDLRRWLSKGDLVVVKSSRRSIESDSDFEDKSPDALDQKKLLKAIRKMIKAEMTQQTPKQASSGVDQQVVDTLNAIKSQLASVNLSPVSSRDVSRADVFDDLDEDTIAEIQARKVSKLAKGVQKSVHYSEKQEDDDTIDDYASELGDLI